MRISQIGKSSYLAINNSNKRNFLGERNNKLIASSYKKSLQERGQIITPNGDVFNRHITEYCRYDMNWVKLENILRSKYPNPDNVNFIIYAASSGEEPYTMAILLKKIYGKTVPIKAFDISQDLTDKNIQHQKDGVKIEVKDVLKILKTLNLKSFEGYFKADKTTGEIKLDKKITDCVEFECSNILEDIDNMDKSKPTVLMARNMWPYVHFLEYNKFCKKLQNTLAANSIFIIGSYDYNGDGELFKSDNFPHILSKNGFRPVSNGIFESFRSFDLIFEKK